MPPATIAKKVATVTRLSFSPEVTMFPLSGKEAIAVFVLALAAIWAANNVAFVNSLVKPR